jgi:AcrR family transcriptional regulator
MSRDANHLSDTVSHNVDPLPSSSPRDARAVRSSAALQTALLALIERKPLDQITVREIATEAGVHYATFFRHHPSKEALLDDIAAQQIDRLVELTVPVLDNVDSYAATLALCRYVSDHRTLWTALLTGGAAGTMRDELLGISRQLATERTPVSGWLPVDLAVNCSVSLIFETLAWWLTPAHAAIPIEQVARTLDRLLRSVETFAPTVEPASRA